MARINKLAVIEKLGLTKWRLSKGSDSQTAVIEWLGFTKGSYRRARRRMHERCGCCLQPVDIFTLARGCKAGERVDAQGRTASR
jgi:hypothetical protein